MPVVLLVVGFVGYSFFETDLFAPLNLGGFEVYASRAASDISGGMTRIRAADAAERLVAFGLRITPIYVTLTVLLAFGLLMSGERAFNAVILAMATLSTSGITAGTGMETSGAGAPGEVLVRGAVTGAMVH